MSWLYAPGLAGSSLESGSPNLERGRFVTWRGKHMRRQFWSRAWNKAPWIRRLFGTTSEPLTREYGVASLIASWRVSRANRLAPLERSAASSTSGTCGPRSRASFATLSLGSSFWRTSQVCLFETWGEYCESWPDSGSMRNGACSQRPRLALPICDDGYSSWPSARAEDSESCGNHPGSRGDSLSGVTRHWPTPAARDDKGPNVNETHATDQLQNVATRWPTPKTPTGGAEAREGRAARGSGGEDLGATASLWQTPGAATGGHTSRGNERSDEPLLTGQAYRIAKALWPTPAATEQNRSAEAHERESEEQRAKGNRPFTPTLGRTAQAWPTPTEGDSKSSGSRGGASNPGTSLTDATCRDSRPDPSTLEHGGPSSTERRTLNPRFVEWLMGFPIGWTDLEDSATESFLSWRQRHGGS